MHTSGYIVGDTGLVEGFGVIEAVVFNTPDLTGRGHHTVTACLNVLKNIAIGNVREG